MVEAVDIETTTHSRWQRLVWCVCAWLSLGWDDTWSLTAMDVFCVVIEAMVIM